jgi:hypothetical protein
MCGSGPEPRIFEVSVVKWRSTSESLRLPGDYLFTQRSPVVPGFKLGHGSHDNLNRNHI